jgi:hypothetical protein
MSGRLACCFPKRRKREKLENKASANMKNQQAKASGHSECSPAFDV